MYDIEVESTHEFTVEGVIVHNCEWWIYQPFNEYRWLMDLLRTPMDADDFLDWNENERKFTGILEEWVGTSVSLGVPITHVIVEQNAAQRFILQFDHVRRWMAKRSVEVVAHNTHRNKSDPLFGVQTIGPHYQFGRVRLPYKRNSDGFNCSMQLINEVTKYPPRAKRRLRDGPLVHGVATSPSLLGGDWARQSSERPFLGFGTPRLPAPSFGKTGPGLDGGSGAVTLTCGLVGEGGLFGGSRCFWCGWCDCFLADWWKP